MRRKLASLVAALTVSIFPLLAASAPEVWAPGASEVELGTGALRLERTDLTLKAPSADLELVLARSYTSAGIVWGEFGWGWSLAGLMRLRVNPDGTVDLYQSGERYVFSKDGPGADGTTLTALGHPGELKKTSGGWFVVFPDGSYAEFGEDGYMHHLRDRNRKSPKTGSEIAYHWQANGTLAMIELRNGLLDSSHPHTIVFAHNENGHITKATDSTGRVVDYAYDPHGRLRSVTFAAVQLSADGATGQPGESYEYDPVPADTRTALDTAGQVRRVKDAAGQLELEVAYTGLRVRQLTRGSGADAVKVTIADAPAKSGSPGWLVTEGVAAASPTTTLVNLAWLEAEQRWQLVETRGSGSLDLTTTTFFDRDERVVEQLDPGGIRTVTRYKSGRRKATFSPEVVEVHKGVVGEERPETPPILTSVYDYQPGTNLVTSITRPGAVGQLTTTISRDANGNVRGVTYPDGSSTTVDEVDELGRPRRRSSSTGSSTAITYDDVATGSGEPWVVTTTSAAGSTTTTVQRDQWGNPRQTTVADGVSPDRVTWTAANALGWTLETRAGTSVSRTSYEATGRIARTASGTSSGDGFSALTTTVPGYTSAGMVATITRSEGAATELSTMTYDDAGRLVSSTAAGLTTEYSYDSAGLTRTSTLDPDGLAYRTTYGYDPAGRLETTLSPGGRTHRTIYDKLARVVATVDPAGVREELSLTTSGQLVSRTLSVDGVTWGEESFQYDTAGRQTHHTVHRFPVTPQPDPSQERLLTTVTAYYPDGPHKGLVYTVTDPLGRVTEVLYDDAGREKERRLPDGTVVATAYYPDGKVRETRVGVPGAWEEVTTTTYDSQGRVRTVTDPTGRVTTTQYDPQGRRAFVLAGDSEPDPASGDELPVERLSAWSYGDLGRVVTEQRSDGARITRTYDESGNLVSYEDTDGNLTEYRYDRIGRLERLVYPGDAEEAPSRRFTYLPDGEVDTVTRADGSQVDFAYEPGTGRLDTVTVTDGVQPGGVVNFDYDPLGNLTSAADLDVSLAFTWDSAGNQLSESLTVAGVPGGFQARQLSRSFDLGNRPAVLRLPDGTPYLQRLYDTGDRLAGLYLHQTAPSPLDLADPTGGRLVWSARHSGSRMIGVERGNGLTTSFGYDQQGRPLEVLTGRPGPDGEVADPLHRLGLSWTGASLRRSKTREDLNRTVERFHYDQVGHLESSLDGAIPAVVEASEDLAALTGLSATSLTEDWQVNTVDELTRRARVLEGRREDPVRLHPNPLHQVERVGARHYLWDENGNLQEASTDAGGTQVTDAVYTHDWRDRLVGVEQGDVSTRLVVDPLGRLVAKVKHTAAGDTARVYLHDGDQVVAEYVQAAGGTSYHLDRRMFWGTWIDQLVATEVDTDHNGTVETTLYPVTDLLGSVQLLTDASGRVVERVEYDADGTPHFASGDAVAPAVTRVAWTGNGTRPTGDTVTASAFEVGFSEWLAEASAADATATLSIAGGEATSLTVSLDAGGRGVVLTGATVATGESATLHMAGLRDRAGNAMPALELPLTVADGVVYEVVSDTTPPRLLAVMDATDGLYLAFDEPVVAAGGGNLATAVTVTRSGGVVGGTTSRVSANVVRWAATDSIAWLPTATYTLTAAQLVDTSPAANAADLTALPLTFAHLAETPGENLVAYEAGGASQPRSESGYGVTSLFQGRGWHRELGLYYYRGRWYEPEAGVFLQRDPLGRGSSVSTAGMPSVARFSNNLTRGIRPPHVGLGGVDEYSFLDGNPVGFMDPHGEMTSIRYEESTNTIYIKWHVEFYPRREQQAMRDIVERARATWTKDFTDQEGRTTHVVVEVDAFSSESGDTDGTADQVEVAEVSRVTTQCFINGEWARCSGSIVDPDVYRRDLPAFPIGQLNDSARNGTFLGMAMTRSLNGRGSRGLIVPREMQPGNTPSVPGHEFGHILGFQFHTLDSSYAPAASDPMFHGNFAGGVKAAPSSLRLREYHVLWFKEVAKRQLRNQGSL